MKKHRHIGLHWQIVLYGYSVLWLLVAVMAKLLSPFFAGIRRQAQHRHYKRAALQSISTRRKQFDKCVLFYCSSAGEYEQAKPLIDRLQATHYVHVLLFSASGYQFAKKLGETVDFGMVPRDTVWDWKRLLGHLQPSVSIIVRHEFWPGFILQSYQYSRTVAIDVFIRENTSRLSLWLKNFLFAYLDHVFVVADQDLASLSAHVLKHAEAIGNTKFDRAVERLEARSETRMEICEKLDQLLGQGKRCVVGSAWREDVVMALDALQTLEPAAIKLMLVPHDVSEEMVHWIVAECDKRALTNSLFSDMATGASVLIVDSVGALFELYACSDMTLVGGGFKQGVHNIVEAAVSEIPIASGPLIASDREAMLFAEAELLTIVADANELAEWLKGRQQSDPALQQKLKARIQADSGTADKILASIGNYL